MSEWKECTISDLGTVIGGATPSTKNNANYENGTIAWITPKDLSTFKGRYIKNGERNITEIGLKSCSAQLLPPNTVLFSSRAPIGYIAIAENELCTNQGFKSVVPNEETDPLFLYYLLKYNKEAIENMGSGTTFKEVSGNTMKNIIVRVPVDKREQQRIAEILGSLDDKIEGNEKINNNLEQQARALYQSIANDSSQSVPLSEFMIIKHGYAFKGDHITFENNNVVLVTPGNFKIGGGFQENRCKYFTSEYPSGYVLRPGDLIVTMTDLSKEADTLGYSALIPDNPERIYLHNQRIGLIQFTNNAIPKDYVYWFLRSYDYHVRIVGSASGSTVRHTSPSRILEQMIPIPYNLDNPKIFLLKEIDETVAHNELEIIKLSNIRAFVLPQLMSGKIDISDINI